LAKRTDAAGRQRNEQGEFWSVSSLRGPGRARNSDSVGVSGGNGCRAFVVADGVGALEASPRAILAAVRAAVDWTAAREHVTREDAGDLVGTVDLAVRAAVQEKPGATTLAYAVVERESGLVVTVGDSEVLAIYEGGPATRLNPLDHVPAQPNMLLAWIDGKVELEPHVITLAPLPYRLVLATDGVTGILDHDVIAEIVRRAAIGSAAEQLVAAAREGGAQDDASAIVIAAPAVNGLPG
jgi:serine/threonine protein phosphatase PrpC